MLEYGKSSCAIVGGTSGIGAAFAEKIKNNYKKIYVFGLGEPVVKADNIEFVKMDLSKGSLDAFDNVINECNTLIITAGIGRVDSFDNLDEPEIEKVISVNFTSTVKLIKHFYAKLNNKEDAYCMTMGSLAGELSSPLFSIYGATKAALNRFVESINIELEKNGTNNRILNVMPISFKGSSFNGGKTDINVLSELADSCLEKMYTRETTFIPDYDSVCKGILERYHKDPHEFGLSSYDYKIENNRINHNKQYKIGYLSGTFDLFHIGHLNLIRRAKEQCDYLIVGVHFDASHKGKETFIPFEERKAIVGACGYVDKVIMSEREDSDVWSKYHYDMLFVGSDYKGTERFNRYEEYFKDKGVKIVYFPYTKGTSSTQLRGALSSMTITSSEPKKTHKRRLRLALPNFIRSLFM